MGRKTTPCAAVIVETSNGWGRALVRGIGNYARTQGPWHLWIDAWGLGAPIPLPGTWRGDGIIADVCGRAMAEKLAAIGVPVVNVSVFPCHAGNFPRITTDLGKAARLAAAHLLDRGLGHFGYCGLQRPSQADPYGAKFAEALGHAGYACPVFQAGKGASLGTNWPAYHQELRRWLQALPKPVGILAWPSKRGRQVLHACQEACLLVPEEVAVLVGDEDELLCDVCHPPLSGVALNSEQLGQEAAALLQRFMRGQRVASAPIFIEPLGVVSRQSTDTLAIQNADLAQAIAFIRNHAAEPMQVEDVLRAVPMSRRRLEQCFREILGKTPAEEIRRVHFERARQLLAQSTLSIPEVAMASGFGSPEYLARVFKRETGLTPHQYRNKVQGR